MIHLLKIGRDSENDIVINEASVSGKHAELFKDDEGRVFLTDLNSKNGTFINGKRIKDSVIISKGDDLALGSKQKVQWEEVLFPESIKNKKETAKVRLIKIGRDQSNDVVLKHESISEFHAALFKDQEDRVFLTDLNSKNGTHVNGKRISDSLILKRKDVVKLANNQLVEWKNLLF